MTTGQEYRHYVRSALGRRRFNLLIFFVTSRCNAKCDFAFTGITSITRVI